MPHFTDDPKVLLRRLRPHVRALLLHELHLDEQPAIVAQQHPNATPAKPSAAHLSTISSQCNRKPIIIHYDYGYE